MAAGCNRGFLRVFKTSNFLSAHHVSDTAGEQPHLTGPFFVLMCLGAALITVFPEIALWLPQVLFA